MLNTRTPLFLMANLGAEVSRIFSFKEKNDAENLKKLLNIEFDDFFEPI